MRSFPEEFYKFKKENADDFSFHVFDPKKADIFFSDIEANIFIDDHTHENTVYNLVTKGTFEVIVEGVKKVYMPGDWIEIHKNTVHAVKSGPEGTSLIEFWMKN